ncbi:PH domain-containing protein [Cellulomonas sp. ICMP 17802]|uniref:PH domain-containing protein n=1 Tax=Cellulomonas sp. ICMP 17802 TaxID=3239199 RepID=UPI00351AE9F2
MGTTQEFSSIYGRWLTGATALLAVVAMVVTLLQEGAEQTLRLLPVTGAIVLVVWALFWRPAVEVSDGEIVVRNVLATVRIPWPAYRGVTVKYSLVLHTTGRDVTAWAAPRSSATGRWLRSSRRRPASAEPRREHGSAEAVAEAVVDRHDALAAAGYLRGAEVARVAGDLRPVRSWHWATIAGTVVLAALATVTLG